MKDLFVLSAYTSKINATGWWAWIGLAFGAIVSFIFPTPILANAFVVLMFADLVTGIIASRMRKEKLESAKLRGMFFKWLTYLIIIGVAACLDLVTTTAWIRGAALGWVMLSEGISILENCEGILKKKIPFISRIKQLVDALKGKNSKE